MDTFYFLSLVFSAIVIKGACERCYECTTLRDGKGCGDTFMASTAHNLNMSTPADCLTCGKIAFFVGSVKVVARICERQWQATACYHSSATSKRGSSDECYCNSDLCNTSGRLVASTGTFAIHIILGVAYLKFLY
ncbi:hypothetical protein MAR_009738 [Mya arenaria]|uniref:Protein quiver n=1 Tax=Mya arenaria TaxID=6604 RepID=A0ABY7E090_MYAAR|nr:hypothetical protein MAR_009738 [Mya arenaria]